MLEAVCAEVGHPKTIRVDTGREFISRDPDLWACRYGVTLDCSRPGKPTDNAFIEAFNGKLRQERLSAHWFLNLAAAREKMEAWRRFYNEDRPHSAIGYKAPIALAQTRRRTRLAAVTRPGNSSPGRPKVGEQRNKPEVSSSPRP